MEPPNYKQLDWGAFGFEKERRMGPKAIWIWTMMQKHGHFSVTQVFPKPMD